MCIHTVFNRNLFVVYSITYSHHRIALCTSKASRNEERTLIRSTLYCAYLKSYEKMHNIYT